MLYPNQKPNPKHHMKKTETTDLKWIGVREVRLRQIGDVGLNLMMAATLTMVGLATLRE